tara:strand:- start:751 stop:1761 length:1011 start_codon:yes stop_codon:yes gene_type:complete
MKLKELLLGAAISASAFSGDLGAQGTSNFLELERSRFRAAEPSWLKKSEWEKPRSFDGLYEEIAKDLRNGEPLIISTYAGLWGSGNEPERNLHWGSFYGPFSMFDRSKKDKHIDKNYENHEWSKIFFEENDYDPVRIAAFEMDMEPNGFWRNMGVDEKFKVYHVMQSYEDLELAGSDLNRNFRNNEGIVINLDDGAIKTGDARIVGYNGHNYYFDRWSSIEFDSEGNIEYTLNFDTEYPTHSDVPKDPKGVFSIGCMTKDFFRDDLIDEKVYGVAFTTSLMAPEGYNLLALADGILQGLNGEELAKKMNESYRYFQVLGGQRKPGPLFVNHAKGLY